VSGGSLCTALIYASNGYAWPSSDQFLATTVPQVRDFLSQHSLRQEITRQLLKKPHYWLKKGGNQLASLLSEIWGITANMQLIADHPRWIINATCYETRKNWRFMSRRMGDPDFGYVMSPDISLAEAVAASAAHPFIGPLSFDVTRYKDQWVDYAPGSQTVTQPIQPTAKHLLLWDGGLYDNLGIESLMKPGGKLRAGIDFLIVSDASAPISLPNYWLGYPSIRRMYDITAYQTQSLRTRMVMDYLLNNTDTGRYIKLGRSADYILSNAHKHDEIEGVQRHTLPDDALQLAATMKTEDTLMPKDKFDVVFRHGFETADLILYAHSGSVAFELKGFNMLTHSPMSHESRP
jgi:NTE family protein